ncbi:hypothetical protein [Mycobacterium sp. 236(2023)]|uniref:hypothetical protein n=1 Tax=Mycobacterium sp. 236(2023) TaxID=3038163 RepID=UPI00241585D0|nr:hypothetical protein [Mycobacterium sp. 236(2023)]MDG4667985.1 hypothetical protein [Mycobacterium sp. 236(2023)]
MHESSATVLAGAANPLTPADVQPPVGAEWISEWVHEDPPYQRYRLIRGRVRSVGETITHYDGHTTGLAEVETSATQLVDGNLGPSDPPQIQINVYTDTGLKPGEAREIATSLFQAANEVERWMVPVSTAQVAMTGHAGQPVVECQPWCDTGDGHPDYYARRDQACWSPCEYLGMSLEERIEENDEQHMQRIGVHARQRPDEAGHVVVHLDGIKLSGPIPQPYNDLDHSLELTPDEALRLATMLVAATKLMRVESPDMS